MYLKENFEILYTSAALNPRSKELRIYDAPLPRFALTNSFVGVSGFRRICDSMVLSMSLSEIPVLRPGSLEGFICDGKRDGP